MTPPKRKPLPPAQTQLTEVNQLARRLDVLEDRMADWERVGRLKSAEEYILFMFDRARWELPALSALSSLYDQAARREQLGALHTAVTLWEKLGHETPNDIGRMVLAMAGREQVHAEPPAETSAALAQGQLVLDPTDISGPTVIAGPMVKEDG